MKVEALLAALRAAGSVERCHTFQHHGSYNIAAHSWGVVVLLMTLHPDPSIELLKAAAFHDIAERWTGDVPCTVKWEDPLLAERLEIAEARVMKRLGIETVSSLPKEDQTWLHVADKLELWLWCQEQLTLGNRNAAPVMERIEGWFQRQDNLPVAVAQLLRNYERV